jgi:hypothetical protein
LCAALLLNEVDPGMEGRTEGRTDGDYFYILRRLSAGDDKPLGKTIVTDLHGIHIDLQYILSSPVNNHIWIRVTKLINISMFIIKQRRKNVFNNDNNKLSSYKKSGKREIFK